MSPMLNSVETYAAHTFTFLEVCLELLILPTDGGTHYSFKDAIDYPKRSTENVQLTLTSASIMTGPGR